MSIQEIKDMLATKSYSDIWGLLVECNRDRRTNGRTSESSRLHRQIHKELFKRHSTWWD